jgi:hypothetical protein
VLATLPSTYSSIRWSLLWLALPNGVFISSSPPKLYALLKLPVRATRAPRTVLPPRDFLTLVMFHGIPQSLRTNSRITPQTRHVCFLPHSQSSGLFSTVITGRDNSVDIATRYGLVGPGIESRWGRDFPQPSRPALGPTWPPIKGVPGLSWK